MRMTVMRTTLVTAVVMMTGTAVMMRMTGTAVAFVAMVELTTFTKVQLAIQLQLCPIGFCLQRCSPCVQHFCRD